MTNESDDVKSTGLSPGNGATSAAPGLSFGDIIDAAKLSDRVVHLPRMNRTVRVRRPSAAVELRCQSMMVDGNRFSPDMIPRARAWRIAQCIRDMDGQTIIGDDDLDILLGLPKELFEELDDAIDDTAKPEDALGNSAATRS